MIYLYKLLSITIMYIIYLVTCDYEVMNERIVKQYVNPLYLRNVEVSSRRLGRGTPTLMNFTGTILHQWVNNVTMGINFYEFRNNEYRRSFVEMSFKACDFLRMDKIFAPRLREYGMPSDCPIQPKTYTLTNVEMDGTALPPGFPYKKFAVNAFLYTTYSKHQIIDLMVYFTVNRVTMKIPRNSTIKKG